MQTSANIPAPSALQSAIRAKASLDASPDSGSLAGIARTLLGCAAEVLADAEQCDDKAAQGACWALLADGLDALGEPMRAWHARQLSFAYFTQRTEDRTAEQRKLSDRAYELLVAISAKSSERTDGPTLLNDARELVRRLGEVQPYEASQLISNVARSSSTQVEPSVSDGGEMPLPITESVRSQGSERSVNDEHIDVVRRDPSVHATDVHSARSVHSAPAPAGAAKDDGIAAYSGSTYGERDRKIDEAISRIEETIEETHDSFAYDSLVELLEDEASPEGKIRCTAETSWDNLLGESVDLIRSGRFDNTTGSFRRAYNILTSLDDSALPVHVLQHAWHRRNRVRELLLAHVRKKIDALHDFFWEGNEGTGFGFVVAFFLVALTAATTISMRISQQLWPVTDISQMGEYWWGWRSTCVFSALFVLGAAAVMELGTVFDHMWKRWVIGQVKTEAVVSDVAAFDALLRRITRARFIYVAGLNIMNASATVVACWSLASCPVFPQSGWDGRLHALIVDIGFGEYPVRWLCAAQFLALFTTLIYIGMTSGVPDPLKPLASLPDKP
ncbi:Hypothetical protein ACGLYG10_2297 [Actinomyces glycerinitolerans]|uniref:Uncharacterized protein n=2 Tax=Actinomyces glycerinitolerans TaxID=1892869 RepID=A0A1M4S1D6_9ACTO|nr:Hypothetical protein ACGLYG10_2297 [Actinomyces glycerinitolerans]